MIPKLDTQVGKGKITKIIGVASIVMLLVAGFGLSRISSAKAFSTNLQANNLLDLISQLGGTTDNMLANTNRLHLQVQQVQDKLGQLSQQEQILQKQSQTGNDLKQQLQTQEQLTLNGISLMKQILTKEQQSVQITNGLSDLTQQLASGVSQNAQNMGQLIPLLGTSLDQSTKLNAQLDQMLAELSKSQDSFKLFGTLNRVIANPLNVQDSLSEIENSALPPSIKDTLKSLLP